MNECEHIHPQLRNYLDDRLSARDRRLVARHLNLCASARKELDQLRNGELKSPVTPANAPSEPWDLKILRWLFTTPKPFPVKEEDLPGKKAKPSKEISQAPIAASRSSALKPISGILLFFLVLALLTHFIYNASENPLVKGTKRWLSKNHVWGAASTLDMVLDLTNLSHWNGTAAPVAFPYHELITDPDRFKVYWALLQPRLDLPNVDFTKYALAVVFTGQRSTNGLTVKFKRMENYSDKTIIWYDEVTTAGAAATHNEAIRPWVIQQVPKPVQQPVLIQKIQ